MIKYDGLAEELILLQERIQNIGKDYFITRAHSPTNPNWDLVAFEQQSGSQLYNKILYQVKEIDWSKNKTICADFLGLNVDFLFVVIFNSGKGLDSTQPVVFKFPKNRFAQKLKAQDSLLNSLNQLTYSQSNKKQYLSLNTIFDDCVFNKIKQYAYYNIK